MLANLQTKSHSFSNEAGNMKIPDRLKPDVAQGRTVLVLGAGASMDARDPDGLAPPMGQ